METDVKKIETAGRPGQDDRVILVSSKWISMLWAIAFTLTLGATMLVIAITSAHHN